MAVVWVVAPCSLVDVYQRFRGPCFLHHQDDEISSPWFVGKLLPDYTTLQPRRQPYSYSLLWEPQILLGKNRLVVYTITVSSLYSFVRCVRITAFFWGSVSESSELLQQFYMLFSRVSFCHSCISLHEVLQVKESGDFVRHKSSTEHKHSLHFMFDKFTHSLLSCCCV
jgi:hypothetical protein